VEVEAKVETDMATFRVNEEAYLAAYATAGGAPVSHEQGSRFLMSEVPGFL
jgi:hypothetical protein